MGRDDEILKLLLEIRDELRLNRCRPEPRPKIETGEVIDVRRDVLHARLAESERRLVDALAELAASGRELRLLTREIAG